MNEPWRVELTRKAEKDVRGLRPWTAQVLRAIAVLEDDHQRGHTLKGSLRSVRSLEFNLRGGGAYRAAYIAVPDERVCVVFIVGSHENFYAKAERRYEALTKLRESP